MHFRVRKNVVQLIRTTYDESKKKGSSSIVGTIRLANPDLSEELRQLLTAEEVAAFEAWLQTHHRVDVLRDELAALTLAEAMGQAERWFEREGDSVAARSTAADIVFQWQSIRRLLAKHGLLD